MRGSCHRLVLPVLVLLILLCSSCLIVTKQPLIDPKHSKPDKQLQGRWVGSDKLDDVYAVFDSVVLETNIFTGQKPHDKNEVEFDLATGTIGKYQYFSIKPRDGSSEEYLLARYEIEGNKLKVWLLDSALIDAAISQGRLKSTKVATSTTVLTDKREKIISFIVENQDDASLFQFLGTFTKTK